MKKKFYLITFSILLLLFFIPASGISKDNGFSSIFSIEIAGSILACISSEKDNAPVNAVSISELPSSVIKEVIAIGNLKVVELIKKQMETNVAQKALREATMIVHDFAVKELKNIERKLVFADSIKNTRNIITPSFVWRFGDKEIDAKKRRIVVNGILSNKHGKLEPLTITYKDRHGNVVAEKTKMPKDFGLIKRINEENQYQVADSVSIEKNPTTVEITVVKYEP